MEERRIYLKNEVWEKEVFWQKVSSLIESHFAKTSAFGKLVVIQKEWQDRPFIEIIGVYDIVSLLEIFVEYLNAEIYGFAGYNVVDGFSYWHYKNKKLVRRLDFGLYGKGERVWNIVEGKAEEWENKVFFGTENEKETLFSLQEWEEDLNMKPLPSYIKVNEVDKLKKELEALQISVKNIFAEKKLQVGSAYPFAGNCIYEVLVVMEIDYFQKVYKRILVFERYTTFRYFSDYLRKKMYKSPDNFERKWLKNS